MLSTEPLSAPCIVQRIMNGEKQAEKELVERYWKGLIFVLNNQCRDIELAQDLAQDTFIVVINKVRQGELNNPKALSGFIRQVGVNLSIAYFRKQQRQKTDTSEIIDLEIPHKQQELLQKISQEKLIALVQQVLDELSAQRDKDILLAYFVEETSKQELCARFELSSAHFDRVIYRARARLKQLLQHKLNVNIEQVSLLHLLSLVLCVLVASSPHHYFPTSLGEYSRSHHYINTEDNRWDNREFHHQKRHLMFVNAEERSNG